MKPGKTKREKRRFAVYYRYFEVWDNGTDTGEWRFAGETSAVSEDKAINNVRFRMGVNSQYDPIEIGRDSLKFFDWKAEEC